MARCTAKTNKGKRCLNNAKDGQDVCGVHEGPKTSHIGNTFALGNSGKPKKWQTPEELQKDIDAYFEECDSSTREVYVKSAQMVVDMPWPKPYTIEGLCEYLDCDRKTLINYECEEGYEEFFHTIKKAKNKIQRDKLERGLSGINNAAVTIFDLKNNHGYKDKSEVHNINENTHEFLDDLFPEVKEDEH